jgi:multiple sugar transport system permease protein
MSGKAGRHARKGVSYLLLGVVLLFALFPLYWLVISALKSPAAFNAAPPSWWPVHPSGQAVQEAFRLVPFAKTFANSWIIAGVCTCSVVVTSTFSGYAFAKYRFFGRTQMFWVTVATVFVPPIVTLVPLYRIVVVLGLGNSLVGVMLPWLANGFGVFLMRQFIRNVPDELIEAARIDGAGEFQIVVRIVAPLVRPALVALGLFAFVYDWNTFIWPLSVLSSDDKYTVVVALNGLMSFNWAVQYANVVLAGAVIASVPTIVVFLFCQRAFVNTMSLSGITGS